jgi:hypothetical protein
MTPEIIPLQAILPGVVEVNGIAPVKVPQSVVIDTFMDSGSVLLGQQFVGTPLHEFGFGDGSIRRFSNYGSW